MALLKLWRRSRDAVLEFNISQVVNIAGDGNLLDDSETSHELRAFLTEVPSESLFSYARYCLDNSFNSSGLVLQDLVNELGRRLEFTVVNGRYRGKAHAPGFDGTWRYQNEPDLIVEVKTTDVYSINLEVLAGYRESLVLADRVRKDSSILIVVGRSDTDSLEAQVRGSRYAWDMRLIGVEALIKLAQVKEKSDDSETLVRIRQLLQPFEYTKLDRIIDVVFATAIDVEGQVTPEAPADGVQDDSSDNVAGEQTKTENEAIRAKRTEAVEAFARSKGKELIQRTRVQFWSSDRKIRVCCAVSKRYEREGQNYWYGYQEKWDEFLSDGEDSYLVLACMDRNDAVAIPYSWIAENKVNLNKSDRPYWHIALATLESGRWGINLSKIGQKVDIEPYKFVFGSR